MKKIALLLTVFVSAISVFADSVEIDGIYYYLDNINKTAEVTNNGKMDRTQGVAMPEGNSYSGDVVIPSSVIYDGETYSVTRLRMYSFYKCSNLTSIEIPNSVTEIEERAIEHCSSLSSVKLSNTLKNIGSAIFNGCTSLVSIDIPESVEYIGELAFMNCTSLSYILIPRSVKFIEDAAFKGCTGLKSVNISNSVNRIGEQAFKNCSELTSVTIGVGLSTIAEQAFWGCDKLESVTVLATTPPEFDYGTETFSHYGTLHVKKGCKKAYSNDYYWKNFNIVEDADADVKDYTYKPMLEEGMVWNYVMNVKYLSGTSEEDFEEIKLDVPYTVSVVEGPDENGIVKLYESFNTEEFGEKYSIKDRYTYRQENNKVIAFTDEGQLLDFNLKKGDRVTTPIEETIFYEEYYEVIDEDFISVKGRTYRRLHIKKDNDGDVRYDYWVEGIGSKNHVFLTPIITPYPEYTPDNVWRYFSVPRLVSIYKDGECIFEPDDFDTPGFKSGIEENVSNSTEPVLGFYDLQGRKLGSEPQKGIYIKNGRKVVK